MLKPRHKLDESMVKTASETLADCDAMLLLVDASQPPDEADTLLALASEQAQPAGRRRCCCST